MITASIFCGSVSSVLTVCMLSRLGHQLTQFKDKELGSTLTTTNRFLRFLDTLAVAASTGSSSFDPGLLRNGRMTVYLVLPPEHMRAQSALLRMWISSLMRAVVRGGLGEKHKVHFVLDEAASLGYLDPVEDALDKYRGYGVRVQFYYQSIGQLKKCWPHDGGQNLLANTSKIFFGVNEAETADLCSRMLGEETIIAESGGTSYGSSRQYSDNGPGSTSSSWNGNDNWQQHARHLLKPDEVVALPERIAITFTPGVRPICTQLVRYYEERGLGRRPGLWWWFWPRAKTLVASIIVLVAAILVALCFAEAMNDRQMQTLPVPQNYQSNEFRMSK